MWCVDTYEIWGYSWLYLWDVISKCHAHSLPMYVVVQTVIYILKWLGSWTWCTRVLHTFLCIRLFEPLVALMGQILVANNMTECGLDDRSSIPGRCREFYLRHDSAITSGSLRGPSSPTDVEESFTKAKAEYSGIWAEDLHASYLDGWGKLVSHSSQLIFMSGFVLHL
jgi:hypothetical protein